MCEAGFWVILLSWKPQTTMISNIQLLPYCHIIHVSFQQSGSIGQKPKNVFSPSNKLLWATGLIFSLLHPETCLFTYCRQASWCYLCPPLCSNSFCWQHKVLIWNSMIWLPTGFIMFFSEATWIHCKEVSYTVIRL